MIVPATYTSALTLLFIAFVCLGCWANALKLTGSRWRFEFFYLDFSLGAFLLATVAGFALGSSGNELGIGDRVLVAGRMAQVWAIAGGVVFNIGNLLLVAAVSLLGMSAAFPLSTAVALVVTSAISLRTSNILLLCLGMVCCLVAAVLETRACIGRAAAMAPVKRVPGKSAPIDPRRMRMLKGLITGVFGGIFFGFFYQLAATGIDGDFGLGPYAGVFLFTIGILGSTILLMLCFTKASIEGTPAKLSSYFRGTLKQHLWGWAGGAIWAGGFLAVLLARMAPAQTGLATPMRVALPVLSALLYVVWGLLFWKEFAAGPAGSKRSLTLGAVLLAAGIVLVANGLSR